jgi:hypothetical protein
MRISYIEALSSRQWGYMQVFITHRRVRQGQ